MSQFDELGDDFPQRVQSRPGRPRANFGTIGFGSRIKCADCDRPGVVKSGKLWLCRSHAPRSFD